MAGKKAPTVFTYRLDGTLTIAVWVERKRVRLGTSMGPEVVWGYEVREHGKPLFKSKGVGQPNFELVTDQYATTAYAAAELMWYLMPEEGSDKQPYEFKDHNDLTRSQMGWFLSGYKKYGHVRKCNHLGWYPGAEFLLGDNTWTPLGDDGLPLTGDERDELSE